MANINEVFAKISAIAKIARACQSDTVALALASVASRADRREIAACGGDPVAWATQLASASLEGLGDLVSKVEAEENQIGAEIFPGWAELGIQERFVLRSRVAGNDVRAARLEAGSKVLRRVKAIRAASAEILAALA